MAMERQSKIQNSDDEISVKDLILKIQVWWNYLLSRWLIIVAVGIGGGILGVLYANLQKPVYSANTTFVLEEAGSSNNLGSLGGIASIVGVDVGKENGLFQGNNIFELYKSRSMIEKTLLSKAEGELLIDIYIEYNDLKKDWKPELQKINFQAVTREPMQLRLRDSIMSKIVKDINSNYLKISKLDEKLTIYNAVVESENEYFAKAFNEQIVKNVNDFYVQTKTKKSQKNISILSEKVDSVRAVINGNVYNAAVVDDQTPNINPTRRTKKTVSMQLSQISTATNSAILNELVKNLELTKMALLRDAPLIQVVDEPVLPLEKKQLGRIKAFVISGFLFGIFMVLFLTVNRAYHSIMKEQAL